MTEKLPAPTPNEIQESKTIRFEVENSAGNLMKYLVSRADPAPDDKYPETRFFLNNLDKGFVYVGQIDPESGRLTLTPGSKFSPESTVFRVARFALSVIWGKKELPPGAGEIRKTAPKQKAKKPLPKLGRENEEPLPF